MKKISLLIPVYNEEESLGALVAALLPLLDNTHTGLEGKIYDWEAVLIDDGSIDRSAKKLNIVTEECNDSQYKNIQLKMQ